MMVATIICNALHFHCDSSGLSFYFIFEFVTGETNWNFEQMEVGDSVDKIIEDKIQEGDRVFTPLADSRTLRTSLRTEQSINNAPQRKG